MNNKLYKYITKYIQTGGDVCLSPIINTLLGDVSNIRFLHNDIMYITINNKIYEYKYTKNITKIIKLYECRLMPPIAVKIGYKNSLNDDFIALCYLQTETKITNCSNVSKWSKKIKNDVNNNTCKEHIIKSYMFVKNINEQYIIMPCVSGSLSDYFKDNLDISEIEKINIILKIVYGLDCLINVNLFYTDLKTDNILYKLDEHNNCIDIIFGDIGSAFVSSSLMAKTTYPSYERRNTNGIFQYPTEKDVVWSLGILILNIIGVDISIFMYKSDIWKSSIELNIDDILAKINDDIFKILIVHIIVKEESRISLKDIIEILHEYRNIT